MSDNAIVVICTRPDSKRIPRKCFQKIAGVPALDHILTRLQKTGLTTILAIPMGTELDYKAYADGIRWPKVYLFSGNPDSPLHRMKDALDYYSRHMKIPKYVVRITHDDLLVDSETILELLAEAEKADAGYAISFGILEGAGVEVIHASNIMHAANSIEHPVEHISYFVKGQNCPKPSQLFHRPRQAIYRPYRMTMDYPEDIVVLETVLRKMGANATNDDICAYLDMNHHVLTYNRLPEVTVYTCVKNGAKWINEAMRSVLQGDFSDLEYIVIDDQSDDATLGEVLKFDDRRIRILLNDENLGLASSCNRALKEARGKFLIRVDADDILKPSAIREMLSEIKTSGAAIVYSNYELINEDGTPIFPEPASLYHHAGCSLMDKRLINEIQFTDGLRHWEGLDLYTRIRKRFPISYCNGTTLWYYRQRPTSLSKSNPETRDKIKKQIEASNGSI